ncbi:MAG: type 4a pilus biogenesis protein PilO [Candidatus Levybacteria bacterium]|nr:type 4a pilus biogenesis protein PilO [Candidatus Levybacteria bacterium]
MKKNKDLIKEELKSLIDKSNGFLNTGNNRQQATAYLYVIFSLIALSFFGLFAIGPTITTISDLNKQYEEDTVALEKLQDKNAALKSLSSQFIDIQADLILIDNAIPQSPKIAELTRQLEYLSVINNLAIEKLDTGLMELFPAKNTNTPLFSYTFTIGVNGTELDINNFLSDVINMGRIVGIDKLSTGKQQNNLFTASITGRAFFYKQ